jgi:hypothetical protein
MERKPHQQTTTRPRTRDARAWSPGRWSLLAGTVLTAAIFSLLASGAASAELLRCADANGRTIYTDNPSLCPGADPFQPKGEVHGIEPDAAVPPAAPEPSRRERSQRRRRVAEAEAAEAARWKQKRLEKEQELEQILARREQMRELVSHCNRGGQAITLDDAGIKRRLSCSVVREEFDSLDTRESSVRSYLHEGLQEECRRAGCLPGWIR